MKRRSFLAPAPTPRSLPATTSRPVPRRITPEDAAKIVSQDIDLTGDILSSIAQAVIAAGLVGTITVASGSSRLLNGIGAAASLVAMTPIVNVLRKKRAWEVLSLIERANNQDTQAAIFAALAERAIQYQEKGITVMQSAIDIDADDEMYALPPSSAQEFAPCAPQFATAPAYDEYELDDDYDEPAPAPMVQPMAQPPIAPQFQPPASQPTNWLKEAVERRDEKGRPFFPHYNLAGTTGDGKTTTADFIARTFMAAHGSKPYLINPKHKPLEPEWSIEPECEDIEDVLPHLSRCLADMNERRSIKNPEGRLIIIDEIDWIINTYGNEAKKAVQSLFKVGRSVGINLLLVGQSPLATDTGFSGADFRNFFRMVLSSEAIPFLSNSQFPYPEMKEVLKGKAAEIQASTRYWGLILPKGERPSIKAMPHLETPSGITYFTRSQSTDRPVAQPHQPIAPAQPTPPRSPKQPMLQLMPQGGIMDDRPTTSELEPLPTVASHAYQFEGMQPVVMKEPPILRLLNERDNVRAIVRALIDWGGTAEARKVQQQRQCVALRTPAGIPYNAETIARYMAFLAENYSEYFAFDGKTLTTKNDEVLTWQLRK
jgi:hypothetical protein